MEKINRALALELEQLKTEGRAKLPERIIDAYYPPEGNKGPRYGIKGYTQQFIRMNSNSYLAISNHPKLIAAADKATHRLGVGPGSVRFIDGSSEYHITLETRIAKFIHKPAAKIFNSAYTANLALALTLTTPETYWIGDALNHNSIIRSMRIANVSPHNRSIYQHNDMASLAHILSTIPDTIKRVCVVFDGVFSMRGDHAAVDKIQQTIADYQDRFEQGIVTIVDDSHGIGAMGDSGRGVCEYTGHNADILVGTFGKAFGVNGGFIASSAVLTEAIRQKADTYIYTNPLSAADCAAVISSIDLLDSNEGKQLLRTLKERTMQFREGLTRLGLESIDGDHPVVPILLRDTHKTHRVVRKLFERGVLVVGLTFPVVPKGEESIRTQMNAGLTSSDIEYVIASLQEAM